ncbi:hypothetical protein [Microbacterium oxydans]|uniref:hypothetical protein n=1 Tax=Microbacterium oxydans TaxID=82380 RepID=UPI00366E44CA
MTKNLRAMRRCTIGASLAIALSTAGSGCSTPDQQSFPVSVNGTEFTTTWTDVADDTDLLGVAVLFSDGMGASDDTLRQELHHSALATVAVSQRGGADPAGVRGVLTEIEKRAVSRHLCVIGVGDAGTPIWSVLSNSDAPVIAAVLVDSPLPRGSVDYASFNQVSVRGIYAENSHAYENDFQVNHEGMQAVNTPHDFLVFGGDSGDRFFDSSSPGFHEPTVAAAVDGIADWCATRITLGRVETADHPH